MNFLNQLKAQAQSLQAVEQVQAQGRAERIESVERAAHKVWRYLDELAAQLTILQPDGPRLSADGKTPWPAMRASDFRTDARRKKEQDVELFDYIIMAWKLTPKMGVVVQGSVSAVLLAEVQAIEAKLNAAQVRYEKTERRIPPRNALESVRFDYATEARGVVRVQPRHATGQLEFTLTCVTGLEARSRVWSSSELDSTGLDELAKLIVGQDNRFF